MQQSVGEPNAVAVQVDGLCKHYELSVTPLRRFLHLLFPQKVSGGPLFHALNEVSFSIHRGESVAIIGRNGSGKSTLLQIISQTLAPSAGRCVVDGRIAALLELGAGFNPEFTGLENIRLNAAIFGLNRTQIEAVLPDIIAFSEIGDFIHQPVKTYSSGMFLRLAFSVIVHVDADILIVDEALAVGDMQFVQKCMRFIRHFAKKGTLLFVSHDVGMVTGLCDRAIWLDQGKLRMDGSAREVTEAYVGYLHGHESAVVASPEDGQGSAKQFSEAAQAGAFPEDVRHQSLVRDASLANQLQVIGRGIATTDFGNHNARIERVALQDAAGEAVSLIHGGESVVLSVTASVDVPVDGLVVGFLLKDRLGQYLFGDNTLLDESGDKRLLSVRNGQRVEAQFAFRMPYLANGKYAITVAVSDCSNDQTIQLDWQHEALLLESDNAHVAMGLIGVPLSSVTIRSKESE